MKKHKTVCVAFALGCPRSEMDTAWLTSYFRTNGWRLSRHVRNADVVVVAACGFAAHIEDESVRLLSILDRKRHRDSQLVVVGCLAGINAERVLREFDAIAIPPANLHRLDKLIGANVPLQKVPPVNCVEPRLLAARTCWSAREVQPDISAFAEIKQQTKRTVCSLLSRVGSERFAVRTLRRFSRRAQGTSVDPTFYIRVARGCLEECTYCAIRLAAGPLRSKPLDDVLAQFDRGLAQKYQDFELIAEDTGSYGLDIASNCVELLERLFSRRGKYRFVITDMNVRYVIRFKQPLADVLAAHADRIRQLKIPVQSGSDRILQRMRRGYTGAEAKAALAYLKERVPAVPLETHVLIGFPGETEADFEGTLDLLRAVRFDRIQVYRYTGRPGTPASALSDKVPQHVQQERITHLLREFPEARATLFSTTNEDSDGMATPSAAPAMPSA